MVASRVLDRARIDGERQRVRVHIANIRASLDALEIALKDSELKGEQPGGLLNDAHVILSSAGLLATRLAMYVAYHRAGGG